MQLDDLLQRYFASTELAAISPETLEAGIEHCRVDLGLEKDRGKRFALWALLHMLGSAPDLDVAFESEQDREGGAPSWTCWRLPKARARPDRKAVVRPLLPRTRDQSGFLREQS